jgi:DNA-binding transcriptional LysR family regulator
MSAVDIRRLDLTLLLVFAELMRHRKLTTVAERLGLTQSSISHSLRRLREAFGDELFLRRANGVDPTSRAQELEPIIREVIELTRKALDRTRRFDPPTASGIVRISMPDHHCAVLSPPLLDAFLRKTPNLQISVRALVRRAALEALAANEIDVALGHLWRLPEGMRAQILFEDGHRVVARKGHPLLRRPLDLERYLAAEHVLVSLDGDLRGVVDRALAQKKLKRKLAAAVPYFLPALAIAARTDLIATVPRRYAEAFAADFQLRLMPPPIAIPSHRVSAVWHERNDKSGLIKWVVEELVALTRPFAEAKRDASS